MIKICPQKQPHPPIHDDIFAIYGDIEATRTQCRDEPHNDDSLFPYKTL